MAIASSLEELYSYQEALETTWRETLIAAFNAEIFLDSNGNEALVTVHIEQSDEEKTTPFVDISMQHVNAKTQQHIGNDGNLYFNAWDAWMVSRVCTQRGLNSVLQAKMSGIVRAEAARFANIVLDFHTVLQMKDHGQMNGFIAHQILDWSEIFHLITFAVRSDSWPF